MKGLSEQGEAFSWRLAKVLWFQLWISLFFYFRTIVLRVIRNSHLDKGGLPGFLSEQTNCHPGSERWDSETLSCASAYMHMSVCTYEGTAFEEFLRKHGNNKFAFVIRRYEITASLFSPYSGYNYCHRDIVFSNKHSSFRIPGCLKPGFM